MDLTPVPAGRAARRSPFLRGLVCAFSLLVPGIPAPAAATASHDLDLPAVPPGRLLTPSEARLWHEQGIDSPATHLLGLSEVRASGVETELNVVAILVEFPDVKADKALHTPAHYEHLLFSREDDGFRSVAEYFDESSRGRLRLDGVVRGWFTASQKRNDYTQGQGGFGYYPFNSQRLAEEAFYLADPTVNYARFDTEGRDGVPDSGDDDEIVDGLLVIHAGQGREGGGGTVNDFNSVHWWVPSPFPMDGVFGYYFTLNPEDGNIGIFIHELGHLLGLPDLYDTDGGSFGTGRWSMMSGGFVIDDGRTPSDFDAWSKSKLGFANVFQVQANMKDVIVAPTVDSGLVYRMWRQDAPPSEYFLMETRKADRLDEGLPGGGIVIYHVDEFVYNNNNPNRYRVAVEQADGLFQLENRFNDASVGDAGDPFTEGSAFGRYTVPSSLDYDGEESFVHVYNIRGPDPSGAMVADLSVEAGPSVEMVDLEIVELEGNGDGLVSAGELAGLIPHLAVERRAAQGLELEVRGLDPLGVLLDSHVEFGVVPAGTEAVPAGPLRVEIASDLPGDPYGLRMEFSLSWQDAPGRIIPVEIGLGTTVGRTDDFETAEHGWSHAPVRPTAFDQWIYGPGFGTDGSIGFKHGYYESGFLRGSDAELVSPPVLLPPRAALLFDQAVDIQSPDSTLVQAGGVVEVSVNGGDWQEAVPDGGYPVYFGGLHPDWRGRGVFGGIEQAGAFHPVRVDLSRYSGSVRVRFRFFAEVESREGSGWRIDNVRILTDVTPVRVLFAEAVVVGDGVSLAWELLDPLPTRVRWVRGVDPERPEWTSGWEAAEATGSVLDPDGARFLPAPYWLLGLERDGAVSRWGPWQVSGSGVRPAPGFQLRANPVRARAEFVVTGSVPPGTALEIYDLEGRRVYRKDVGGSGGVSWEARDAFGEPVAPGVYFARIAGVAVPTLRVVVLP